MYALTYSIYKCLERKNWRLSFC